MLGQIRHPKRCKNRFVVCQENLKVTPGFTPYSSIVATIRVELSVLVFLAFISKTVNNQCYNPYIPGKIFSRSIKKCMGCSIDCLPFPERSRKYLSGNVWVVALIVYRFRDNRQKHQHRRLNSYRGDSKIKQPSFYELTETYVS